MSIWGKLGQNFLSGVGGYRSPFPQNYYDPRMSFGGGGGYPTSLALGHDPGTGFGGMGVVGGAGIPDPSISSPIGSYASGDPYLGPVVGPAGGRGLSGGSSGFGSGGKIMGLSPDMISAIAQVLGTGASVYGAHKQRQDTLREQQALRKERQQARLDSRRDRRFEEGQVKRGNRIRDRNRSALAPLISQWLGS